MKKIPTTDLDYVELYATILKDDNRLFEQQKKLVESQLKSSKIIFLKRFGDKNFIKNARKYLKEIGLI